MSCTTTLLAQDKTICWQVNRRQSLKPNYLLRLRNHRRGHLSRILLSKMKLNRSTYSRIQTLTDKFQRAKVVTKKEKSIKNKKSRLTLKCSYQTKAICKRFLRRSQKSLPLIQCANNPLQNKWKFHLKRPMRTIKKTIVNSCRIKMKVQIDPLQNPLKNKIQSRISS